MVPICTHLTHGSLDPPDSTQHPKLHLDWFSRFSNAHDCDRPTDRPHYSVRSNRLHLHGNAMPPNNNRVNRYHAVIDHIHCRVHPVHWINADSASDGCRPQTRQLSRAVCHLTCNDSSETTGTSNSRDQSCYCLHNQQSSESKRMPSDSITINHMLSGTMNLQMCSVKD